MFGDIHTVKQHLIQELTDHVIQLNKYHVLADDTDLHKIATMLIRQSSCTSLVLTIYTSLAHLLIRIIYTMVYTV